MAPHSPSKGTFRFCHICISDRMEPSRVLSTQDSDRPYIWLYDFKLSLGLGVGIKRSFLSGKNGVIKEEPTFVLKGWFLLSF